MSLDVVECEELIDREVAAERAAIVAWLRFRYEHDKGDIAKAATIFAAAIEAGEHETVCWRCWRRPKAEPHTCPYADELGRPIPGGLGDADGECTCCDKCTKNCADEI